MWEKEEPYELQSPGDPGVTNPAFHTTQVKRTPSKKKNSYKERVFITDERASAVVPVWLHIRFQFCNVNHTLLVEHRAKSCENSCSNQQQYTQCYAVRESLVNVCLFKSEALLDFQISLPEDPKGNVFFTQLVLRKWWEQADFCVNINDWCIHCRSVKLSYVSGRSVHRITFKVQMIGGFLSSLNTFIIDL